jgi:hypothetical protein
MAPPFDWPGAGPNQPGRFRGVQGSTANAASSANPITALYNRVRVVTPTTGTGRIALGAATSNSVFSFTEAGVLDGDIVSYVIEDGTDFEIGRGQYRLADGTLDRRSVMLSKIGGVAGQNRLNLSGSAIVYIDAIREDVQALRDATTAASGSASAAAALATAARSAIGISQPGGRLTLQSGTPVMTTTQSGATTVFYTPYIGQFVPLFDGTTMTMTDIGGEISAATTDTTKSPAAIGASKVNDWFVWNDNGTFRIGHGPDWTNDTTRSAGTALVMVKGVLLNNVSITNGPAAQRGTYVGTTRSNASSQLDWIFGSAASGGGAAFHGLYNYYNRRSFTTTITDNGAAYTYTTGTMRQARASAGNQATILQGAQEDSVLVAYAWNATSVAVASAFCIGAIGLDSTTTAAIQRINNQGGSAATANFGIYASAALPSSSTFGVHVITALEQGDGTNANLFNPLLSNQLFATFWG